MGNPRFSIVTPTWNRADIISRPIRSVLGQTFGDWEMVIVDDESTDHTKTTIRSFGDGRLQYILQKPRSERLIATNLGMKNATGDWILLLDSDDSLVDITLEALNAVINQNQEHSCINYGWLTHWGLKTHVHPVFRPTKTEVGHAHFESGKITTGSFIFKRELLEDKDVGYFPAVRDCYQFADVAGIPGYSSKVKTLGNPWGQDYYMFWKITRKYHSFPLNMVLLNHYIRGWSPE